MKLLAVVQGAHERKFQRKYAGYRLGKKGEFFKPAPEFLRMIEKLAEVAQLIERLEKQELEDFNGFVAKLKKQQRSVVAGTA